MRLHISSRDGPARAGRVTLEATSFNLPAIGWLHSKRYKPPTWAELCLTSSNEKESCGFHVQDSFSSKQLQTKENCAASRYLLYPKDCPSVVIQAAEKKHDTTNCMTVLPPRLDSISSSIQRHPQSHVFIVANAEQLLHQQTTCIDVLTAIREQIGYHRLLMMPGVCTPMNLSLLCYLGVDCVDSFQAIHAARHQQLLFPTGAFSIEELETIPCSCPACLNTGQDPSSMSTDGILQHNYHMLQNELLLVKTAIHQGSLRELVETRVRGLPQLTSLLRILDNHYEFLEERTPMTRTHPLLATTPEALTRPEIQRFQQRVITRFRKPAHKKILLLLPCSATKPYSSSASHLQILRALSMVPNQQVIHQMIITSPVGLVPRELELVCPASSYDISVTGKWELDEQQMISTLLKQYLECNTYDHVVVHVPTSLQKFILPDLDGAIVTCEDTPTSSLSLEHLTTQVKELTTEYSPVKKKQQYNDIIASIASYQFGIKAASCFDSTATIKGKYPFLKAMNGKQQLAMLTMPRGLLSLTREGAELIQPLTGSWVSIADDFSLKGSLLAPGVIDADENIRIGDEVFVLRNDKLYAVGMAQMNGREMKEAGFGEAANIRHVVKK